MCIEIGHSKPDCNVIDLYNVPDPTRYLNPHEARIQDAEDISEPLVDYYKHPGATNKNMFNLDDEEDDEDLVDDSDDEEEHRSI